MKFTCNGGPIAQVTCTLLCEDERRKTVPVPVQAICPTNTNLFKIHEGFVRERAKRSAGERVTGQVQLVDYQITVPLANPTHKICLESLSHTTNIVGSATSSTFGKIWVVQTTSNPIC